MHSRFRKDLVASREGLASLDARLDNQEERIVAAASVSATVAAQQAVLTAQMAILNTKATVVGNLGEYQTITAALLAGKKNLYVLDGVYNEGDLEITTDNTIITGESKKGTIIRVPNGLDGVKIYANDCIATSFTVDSLTNSAEACLVVGDGQAAGSEDINVGNNNTIYNCHVIGSSTIFAIYLAGPSYSTGAATLAGYDANGLNSGNKVVYCSGVSNLIGDSFSFSLQKNGIFCNNEFEGRVAFYMNRHSKCCNNLVEEPPGQGIFIAGPSNNNIVVGNIIVSSDEAGIKMQNQLEHTPLLAAQSLSDNLIAGNTINLATTIGIEIAGDAANQITKNIIAQNIITKPGNHGIYLQDASHNEISGNSITQPRNDPDTYDRGSGIYMVTRVTHNNIMANHIYDDRNPAKCHTAIANREEATCTDNVITGNKIYCKNLERTIWVQSDRNIITNNIVTGGYYAGIRLDGASNCRVQGNVLYNNTNETTNAYPEIWLQNGASNNRIVDNHITSPAAPIAAAGITIDAGCDNNELDKNYINGATVEYVNNGDDNSIGEVQYKSINMGTVDSSTDQLLLLAPYKSRIVSASVLVTRNITLDAEAYWEIMLLGAVAEDTKAIISTNTTALQEFIVADMLLLLPNIDANESLYIYCDKTDVPSDLEDLIITVGFVRTE